jgi:hypothetical protein
MANIRSFRLPIDYIYLDRPGIESLYAQIVEAVETSRTTTTQKGLAAKGGTKLALKNLVMKLTGFEAELSAEVTGSRAQTEQATKVQTVEHKLGKLLDYLGKSGEDYFFTTLNEAVKRLARANGTVFISVQDTFNAPQFYGRAIGTDLVNAEGYLLLEKGGSGEYHYGDDYYKQSGALIRLSASITKMRSGGVMGATSHEAVYIRGFGGQHIPLCIFGALSGTSDYFHIKPFAIWK